MAGRTPSASQRSAVAATSGSVVPIQYQQIRVADFLTPEGQINPAGIASFVANHNMQMAQWSGQINQLLGSNGPSVMAAGVDVRGAKVTGLSAPTEPSDAISQAHADTSYSAAAQQPQLDLGGEHALKGLTATYQIASTNTQSVAAINAQITGFTTSTAASGYQTLPSGEIIQWGHSGTIATGPGTVVTFNIPFPTACLAIAVTDDKAGGTNEAMAVTSISAASFTASAQGGSNGVWWIALGN